MDDEFDIGAAIRRPWVAWPLGIGAVYGAIVLLWPAPSGLVVQGLVVGCLTALVAFGLGLVYRASRVVNLAQADLGVVGMTVFASLVLERGWSYFPALAVALGAAALLGVVVERVIIRWFAHSPRLMVMVATLGLGRVLNGFASTSESQQAFVSAVTPGAEPARTLASLFPPFEATIRIGETELNGTHVLIVVVTAIVVPSLFFFLHRTDTGLALRASAESRDRAELLGIPVARVQTIVWVLATMLATVALILRAGAGSVSADNLFGPSFLLQALACAVLARMERFGIMLVAAMALGMLQASIFWATRSNVYLQPIVLLVLVVAFLVQSRGQQDKVADQATSTWREVPSLRPIPALLARLPEVRTMRWGLILGLIGLAVYIPIGRSNATLFLFSEITIGAIAVLSLVILTGWAGEVSLGIVAFVFLGAGVSASVVRDHGLDLTYAVLLAGAAGAAVSMFIGLPAIRARGLYLAVVSLSVAVSAPYFLRAELYLPAVPFLPENLLDVFARRPPVLGRDLTSDFRWFYVTFVALLIAMWLAHGLRRARTSRAIIATKENTRAAQAFGLNPDRLRLLAFGASGFMAGVAGGLSGVSHLDLPDFDFIAEQSIDVLAGAVIGGIGSIGGAVAGTTILRVSRYFAADVPAQFRTAFTSLSSGGGLLLVMMLLPGGLASIAGRIRDIGLRLVAADRGLISPSLSGEAFGAGGPPAASGTTRANLRRLGRGRVPSWLRPGGTRPVDRDGVPLLSVAGLNAGYGPVQVLFGIELTVERGQIVALLGTNGAGKSTLLNAISGLVASTGRVEVHGHDVGALSAPDIVRRGIVQLPGGRGVFPSLTVGQNMRLAAWTRRDDATVDADRRDALARFPVLVQRFDEPAANLSKGEQQMLVMAMSLMMKPDLLLVDELSLGLSPVLVADFTAALHRLRDDGVTILVVDQSVEVALTIADTAYFLEKGEVRFHGPTAELLERPDILRSVFLGEASLAETGVGAAPSSTADKVLEVRDVRVDFGAFRAVDDVSVVLHRGEILGVIGPNGAGKTTLFDVISGFVRPDEGRVFLEGADVTATSPDGRARRGLARSFQDARLFGGLTVRQTIAVALDRHVDVRDPFAEALHLTFSTRSERKVAARVDELIETVGLTSFADRFCEELSTGTRRVVDLACQLAADPTVVLFDEPSSGIAQKEAEALAQLLVGIRDQTGASLLVIEHDMTLITVVADRMVALHLGANVAEGTPAQVLSHPDVVEAYLGRAADTGEPAA